MNIFISRFLQVYSEEKEKHMLKEYNRLKQEYNEKIQNLERKLTVLLSDNEEKYNQRLRDVRMEYVEKLNRRRSEKEISSRSEIV